MAPPTSDYDEVWWISPSSCILFRTALSLWSCSLLSPSNMRTSSRTLGRPERYSLLDVLWGTWPFMTDIGCLISLLLLYDVVQMFFKFVNSALHHKQSLWRSTANYLWCASWVSLVGLVKFLVVLFRYGSDVSSCVEIELQITSIDSNFGEPPDVSYHSLSVSTRTSINLTTNPTNVTLAAHVHRGLIKCPFLSGIDIMMVFLAGDCS